MKTMAMNPRTLEDERGFKSTPFGKEMKKEIETIRDPDTEAVRKDKLACKAST